MEIHHKIKEVRERLNISQERIASKLGISQNTYHLIEVGKSKLKLEHAIKIAEELDLTLTDLINCSDNILNVNGNIEKGGQQINNNFVENLEIERKETIDFLKGQINFKDSQFKDTALLFKTQLDQITRLVDILEKKVS